MKKIRSRTAEKKWRHRFSHYKPMGIFSDTQGQLTRQSVVRAGRNSLFRALMHVIITCKYEKNRMKNRREKVETPFSSITTLWELSVAMETRVLIRSDLKPNAAFPPTQWCFRWNLVVINPFISEIFMFESLKVWTHGRTHAHRLDWYTISSLLSLRLRWAKKK